MFSHSVKIVYFCLVSVLVATAEENSDDGGRIVGGQITTIDQVPYLIQLRSLNGRLFCGGTLVTPRHVVTAAHCVKFSNITAVGGATTIHETGVQRTVIQAFKHPLYNKELELKYNFDVAVLVLNAPMSASNIKTIELPLQRARVGELLQVSGWGITSEYGQSISVEVRTVLLPLISDAQCIRQLGWITPNMICAAAPGKDACSGDSGGPAIAGNKLVGIVSFGFGCARASRPGVYTDVVAALPFINQCLKY